jgi:hypothetical protein
MILKRGSKILLVDRDRLAKAEPALMAQLVGKAAKHRGTRALILGASVLVQAQDEETGKQIAYLVTDAEVEIE